MSYASFNVSPAANAGRSVLPTFVFKIAARPFLIFEIIPAALSGPLPALTAVASAAVCAIFDTEAPVPAVATIFAAPAVFFAMSPIRLAKVLGLPNSLNVLP